jgi:hypothetical protein
MGIFKKKETCMVDLYVHDAYRVKAVLEGLGVEVSEPRPGVYDKTMARMEIGASSDAVSAFLGFFALEGKKKGEHEE